MEVRLGSERVVVMEDAAVVMEDAAVSKRYFPPWQSSQVGEDPAPIAKKTRIATILKTDRTNRRRCCRTRPTHRAIDRRWPLKCHQTVAIPTTLPRSYRRPSL